MASLLKQGKIWHLRLTHRGEKYSKSLKTSSESKALSEKARAEDNLRLFDRGLLGAFSGDPKDFITFLLTDGKVAEPVQVKGPGLTLSELFSEYLRLIPEGFLEEKTTYTLKIHQKHLLREIGQSKSLGEITGAVLQRYLKSRVESGVKPVTVKKELGTLSSVWNHMAKTREEIPMCPVSKVSYPKEDEKPPFRTRSEIEALPGGGTKEDWDALYLTPEETIEVLALAKERAPRNFLYPALCLAAHTGARRSEILRAWSSDVDFDSGFITLREKKARRGSRSTRRVPMSDFLRDVLSLYLGNLLRSKLLFPGKQPDEEITPNVARWAFEACFRDTKWSVLKGWHVFRHSFCSNCASAGVDQRMINEWVGHRTEEMVRRYRHLKPDSQSIALGLVFK